ncbi:methyltransferase [Embleya sp. NPDC050493]|uniref:methyltransferase n=1 Tax=Embleya sp. NPDC050493 TaxID=3363989 RepID=UPI00378C5F9E
MTEQNLHSEPVDDEGAGATALAGKTAFEQVFAMATLFTPWALRTAVTLRLPDLIAAGVSDPVDLATATYTHPESLHRLLRHLVNVGIILESVSGEVELSDLGTVLQEDHPGGLSRILDQSDGLIRRIDLVTSELPEAIRSGGPVWEKLHERPFWADIIGDSELSASFDATMAIHAGRLGPGLAEVYDWSNVGHVVDVGGGIGEILSVLLRTHPHLRGTLVDLPETAARAAEGFRKAGLDGRARVVGQSFFDALPDDGDVYLLSHVIHDWPDVSSRSILRRCREAAGRTGKVLVAERLVPPTGSVGNAMVSQRDLGVLLILGSKERDAEQFRMLGDSADLTLTSVTPVISGDPVFLLEFAAEENEPGDRV